MCAYKLYQSNSLETLTDRYADIFIPSDPLGKNIKIVVQNAGLSEWLLRRLTLKTGAVMGQQFLLPEQSIRCIIAQNFSPEDYRILYLDDMKITVFKALEELLASEHQDFQDLRRYVGDFGEERLWPLSDALAGIFYHYGMNCLPLIEAWESDQFFLPESSSEYEHEKWQRRLWNRIFRSRSGYIHLSQLLSDLMLNKKEFTGEPYRIILFGSVFLGETGLKFFHYLSSQLEVHHFVLSPSRIFTISATSATSTSSTFPNTPPLPFLHNNTNLFAGFAKFMKTMPIESVSTKWILNPERNQTIDKIRNAILNGKKIDTPIQDDGSLEIHCVSGCRRTIEVLKDRILQALAENEDLKPTDIGILAPEIGIFAHHIANIFPKTASHSNLSDNLEFNLIDLPVISTSPCIHAFIQLMELPGSRFGSATLLRLFETASFKPCAEKKELFSEWRTIIEELNIRWGIDEHHRQEDNTFYGSTGSWEHGFRRFITGYFYSEGDIPNTPSLSFFADGHFKSLGELMHTVRELGRDFSQLHLQRRTLKDWIFTWENYTEKWLQIRQNNEKTSIKSIFRNLMALNEQLDGPNKNKPFRNPELPWIVFKSLLSDSLGQFSGRRGRYLTRGVTGSSLKPMRAIPFRRIYLLGMDEGAWPRLETLYGFDLRNETSRVIDLSRDSEDRFAFMETILSATEHISFFRSVQDASTGDPVPPAGPLFELMALMGSDSEKLTRHHPLAPYDQRAFTGHGPLASSSIQSLNLARAYYEEKETSVPAPPTQLPPAPELLTHELPWTSIVQFMQNPVRYFFEKRLNCRLPESDTALSENDVFEPEFLEWWSYCRDVVENNPSEGSNYGSEKLLEDFSSQLCMRAYMADVPISRLSIDMLGDKAKVLVENFANLERMGLQMNKPFQCRLVRGPAAVRESPAYREIRAVDLLHPEDGRRINVQGVISGLYESSEPLVWNMLQYMNKDSMHNRIRGWAAALLMGASENGLEEFRVYALGMGEPLLRRYRFVPDTVDQNGIISKPRELLQELVEIMHLGGREPICLYPDLPDQAKADLGLAGNAEETWQNILNSSTYSRLKNCAFRERCLREPHFLSEGFRRLWENVYLNGGLR